MTFTSRKRVSCKHGVCKLFTSAVTVVLIRIRIGILKNKNIRILRIVDLLRLI